MLFDTIMALVLIALSLVWGYIGIFQLGLWIPGVSADSGFIPTLFSAVTLICSLILLVQSLKKPRAPAAKPSASGGAVLALVQKYAVILFGIFGALCLQYLGLIPMAFLLVFGWMKLLNRFTWAKSGAIAGVVTVVIYLIFDLWLQIPFPGLL